MKPAALLAVCALVLAGCGTSRASLPSAAFLHPGDRTHGSAVAAKGDIFAGLTVTKTKLEDELYRVLDGKLADGRKLHINDVDGLYVDVKGGPDVMASPKLRKQLAKALETVAKGEKAGQRKDIIAELAAALREEE